MRIENSYSPVSEVSGIIKKNKKNLDRDENEIRTEVNKKTNC